MVEGLIGRKVGMTQAFDDVGNVIPVTVIKAGPCTVIQKKTEEKDGYSVLQLSLIEEKGKKRPPRPLVGHYTKSGIPPAKVLREFRVRKQAEVKEGDQFFVDIFQVGERVRVVGTSKGKGFAGVMKRWGFHGGKASHGSMFHRAPGSIGASAFPSRVVKGKKLPGQMGDQRVTVKNVTVIEADRDNNLLVVKGAVPGARGGYVLIKKEDFRPDEPEPERAKPAQPQPEKPEPEEKKVEKPAPEDVKPDKKEPEKERIETPEQEKAKSKEETPEPEKPQPKAEKDESKKDKDEPSEKKESESVPPETKKEKKKE